MKQLNINLNFDALAETGRVGARRAAAFIAMGQKAWADETITSVAVETPFSIKLLPDPMPDDLAKEVRSNFRLWVIGNAITEVVQGLSRFADGFYEIAALVPYHNEPMPQDGLDRIRQCQVDTNLHSKLERAKPLGLKSPLLEHTDGWVRARNALAHNHGVVRERDFSPGTEALTVNWGQFEFSIDGEKIENIIGHHVEKGGMLGFTWVNGSKDFKLGEQISLSEQEILNICFTAYVHIDASILELEKYVSQFVEIKKAKE